MNSITHLTNSINFSNSKVLVVGDIILDKYYIGKVNRISPEAPVPIVIVDEIKTSLGGAANVCNNISELGGNAVLIGILGNDKNRDTLKSLLKNKSIDDCSIEWNSDTITKIRVIGEHQQIVRLDFENIIEAGKQIQNKIKNTILGVIDLVDIIVISDYNKGLCSYNLCQYIISLAKEKHKRVIVDPKGNNWRKYKGATIITPNFKEFGEIINRKVKNNDKEIEKFGTVLLQRFGLDFLLVTRSEMGMSLIDSNTIRHFSSNAREVYDVSGAGDTVIATLALSLSIGLNIVDSIALSNKIGRAHV